MTTTTPAPAPRAADPAVPPPARIRRLADLAVILLFAVGLGVVGFGTFFREQPPLVENRDRHPLPPLAAKRHVLQDYPRWFDLYFGDRVGYRDVLIDWRNRTRYQVFGEPATDRGWIGRDGWLFTNVDDPDRTRPTAPSVDERVRRWADALAERHAALEARGIRYVVLVPPDKSSVYPEHLAGYFARHPPPEPAARLAELLAERGVPCVNPLPHFLQEKGQAPHPLYHRLDSHWTHDGARAAYRLLVNEVGGFEPLGDDGYTVTAKTFDGDLGRLVGLPEREWGEPGREWKVRDRVVKREDQPAWVANLPPEAKPPSLPPRAYTCAAAGGPAAVLFRDSFGEQLVPFLTADFRRCAVVSSENVEWAVIDAERPAVVVQQIVARKLYHRAPAR